MQNIIFLNCNSWFQIPDVTRYRNMGKMWFSQLCQDANKMQVSVNKTTQAQRRSRVQQAVSDVVELL